MKTTYIENHDKNRINYLMNNFDLENYNKILDLRKEEKEITKRKENHCILKKYLLTIIKGDYKYCAEYKMTDINYGRRYCSPSAQSISREIRTFLFPDAKDLDIENCYFNILHKVCIDQGIECKMLAKYTSKRDEFIRKIHIEETGEEEILESDYGCIKSGIKQRLIQTLTTSTIQESFSINFRRFDVEMKKIQNALVKCDYYSFIKASDKKNNYNGSFASHVCQYHENLIIESVEKFMGMNGIPIIGLMFDGLLVSPEFKNLDELNEYIYQETGYPYRFVIKEHFDIIANGPLTPFADWEYKDLPNEKKEKPDEIIHRAFLEWAKKENLIRLANTEKILKRVPNNWGQEVYSDSNKCINGFVSDNPSLSSFWLCKQAKSIKAMLTDFIVTGHPHPDFPCVDKNWRYYSFIDGIYDIVEDNFISEKDIDSTILCCNRFEQKFINLCEKPSVLVKIFSDQDWTLETMDIYCGLMGRLLYPLNSYDTYGVVTCNVGASSSGKSSVLDRMEEIIMDVKSLNTTNGPFSLEGIDTARLISVGEAQYLPKMLDIQDFKKMARGEMININAKHKTPIDIRPKCCMVFNSQEVIRYADASDAIKNRILYFNHLNKIINPDGAVKAEMATLNSQLLVFFNKMYHRLRSVSTSNLKISEQLEEWSNCIFEEQNDFQAWLNMPNEDLHLQVVYSPGEVTKSTDLISAWTKHWQYGLNRAGAAPAIRINQDTCLGVLGIKHYQKNTCKGCNKEHKKGCCENYNRSFRTSIKIYKDCALVPGGKNKKNREYIDPE